MTDIDLCNTVGRVKIGISSNQYIILLRKSEYLFNNYFEGISEKLLKFITDIK